MLYAFISILDFPVFFLKNRFVYLHAFCVFLFKRTLIIVACYVECLSFLHWIDIKSTLFPIHPSLVLSNNQRQKLLFFYSLIDRSFTAVVFVVIFYK